MYELKPLTCDPAALDGLSEKLIVGQYENNYGGAVKRLNQIQAMGKAQGGGSDWVLLAYSPRSGRLLNQWAADHTTTIGDGIVILRSTGTNTRTTSTTAPRRAVTWMHTRRTSTGAMSQSDLSGLHPAVDTTSYIKRRLP